jgi:lysozyme family protein
LTSTPSRGRTPTPLAGQSQADPRAEFTRPAKVAVANKGRYLAIARAAGMPDIAWVFIAVSHYRESSQDFSKSLAQGDPWNEVSVHVPAGRGPFKSFEDAAVDALVKCSPYAAKLKDWSIGGMLTNLERYNGIGYANKGIPSPTSGAARISIEGQVRRATACSIPTRSTSSSAAPA